MKNKALLASAAALVLLSSFLFAPVRQVAAAVAYSGMQIINSTLDSTPIGQSVPAAGGFTTLFANSLGVNSQPNSVTGDSAGFVGWNRNGTGDMDFIATNAGQSPSFAWYFLLGSSVTQEMFLDQSAVLHVPDGIEATLTGNVVGNISGGSGDFTTVHVSGNPGTLTSQGAWFGWNNSGLGETDFFTAPGTGTGGFSWFSGINKTLLMSMNGITGVLTNHNGFVGPVTGNVVGNLTGNGSGTWTGPVNGNATSATTATSATSATTAQSATTASTASALANASPTQCPTGATGIQSNGNANCISGTYKVVGVQLTATNVSGGAFCTTNAGTAFSSCSNTINFPAGDTFADAGYGLSCNPVAFSGNITLVQLSNFTGTSFSVTIFNGDGNGATASSLSQLSCTANHQ
jgi:hypothetical protein